MDGINSPGTTTLGVEVPDHVANTDHSQSSGNSGNGTSKPNGWNGPFAPKKDPYALLRGHMANSRLTAQHYLWKELLGFLVHPDIPTRASDLRVADVATGNGIWLHDLARDKPVSAEFHGFDISLDQVGPRPWLPANIHMHTWNIFEEPPQRFAGYFDIVHVRLITLVIKNDDPRPVLTNLTKLLKPGGFLQWDEVDTIGCSIKTVPGSSAKNLQTLFAQLAGRDTWKYQTTRILNENGYSGSMLHTFEYGLGMARFWSDMYVSTWKEFADNVLKTPEASRELEVKAMEETRDGSAIMVPKLVWVAQKV